MKCRSIACIWSESPQPYSVTAVATLSLPPTLYTGGSDGSIVWWNTSPTHSNQEIQPVALLCGHAAPVADLAICVPTADSRDGERDYTSNFSVSNSADHGALISVCSDGVLCVWSRASGHCRRRRKMPPWVGIPTMVRVLPQNPRYVCIACVYRGGDYSDVGPSKCTVVIVDTYTLAIVQTVYHGNLTIGPLWFVVLLPAMEDMEKQYILLFDSYGKLQSVPLLKEPNSDGANGADIQNYDYSMDVSKQVESLGEELKAVALATSGKILAFVCRTCCIFRFVSSGAAMGEISFVDNHLYRNEGFINSFAVGGIFLDCDDDWNVRKTQESHDSVIENFVVWNNSGVAVVYRITYIDSSFSFQLSSVIPALNLSLSMKSSFYFIQLSSFLLRISSICSHHEDTCYWMPHITFCSLACNDIDLSQECQMLGEQGFYDNSMDFILGQNEDGICKNDSSKYGVSQEGRFVSSTAVISELSCHMPYAVVYGFDNGAIEVVRFNMYAENQNKDPGSTIFKQLFLGHTSSVVCLAAHNMLGFAKGWSFRRVLISGSVDCTIRLWDLDSSDLITVMHHHVAPIRQIIVPSPQIDRPWNDCFLSVGEDNCIALCSLQTLHVERMFPGHLSYPEKVVWDGQKGYLACLCQSHPKTSDALDILYIWDVKAGTRERILHGSASHSMFEHFCKGINSNYAFISGNTSASSSLHALVEGEVASSLNLNIKNIELAKGNPQKQLGLTQTIFQNNKHPISGYCPFPGLAALSFDLASLMFPSQNHEFSKKTNIMQEKDVNNVDVISCDTASEDNAIESLELCLLHFSLSFLHFWNVDSELDKLLITEMKLSRPENFLLASGLQGDRGSLTLTFPSSRATRELWKLSSEFTAMRALTMVSLAQRMISLSQTSSASSY